MNRRRRRNWVRAFATGRKTTTVLQYWTIWTDCVTTRFDLQQSTRGRGAGKGWRSKTKTTTKTTEIIINNSQTTTKTKINNKTAEQQREITAATTPTSTTIPITLKSGHIYPTTQSKATRSKFGITDHRSIRHRADRLAEHRLHPLLRSASSSSLPSSFIVFQIGKSHDPVPAPNYFNLSRLFLVQLMKWWLDPL